MSKDNDSQGMRADRRDFLRMMAGGAAAAGIASMPLVTGCASNATAATKKKVAVLGLDGLDPQIMWKLMGEGRAPNFKKLAEMGTFTPMGTTMPALSPVAWSSFITGMTPSGHGISDFVVRDTETHGPVFSIFETRDITFSLDIGDLQIPIAGGGVQCMRHGKPFWAYLTEQGIPAVVIKVPSNFPVDETATRAIAGMGTPGVSNTYGAFNYYTTDYFEEYPGISGGNVHYVDNKNGMIEANLIGPDNAFFKPKSRKEDEYINKVKVPFQVYVDPGNDTARVEIQGHTLVLRRGEFSKWIPVNFEMAPILGGMSGIVRVMVKETRPHIKVYITPVHVDPANQSLPVTWPKEYGAELVEEIGPFSTKMLPADNKAFDYKILSDENYVQQAQLILSERLALFDYEWSRFNSGLFYFYVSNTDQDAHMLWRNMDPTHPMHKEADPRFSDYIYYLYTEMDRVVGKILPALDDDTLLLVCSDHGFAQYARQFHLNSWLRRQGWLTVKDEARSKVQTDIKDIDWTKTVAYGIGFNGLYINLKGREKYGIVEPNQAGQLVSKITGELQKVVDDDTGQKPVHKVYRREEVNTGGDYMADQPEMLVGYQRGYRNSADSFMGMTGRQIIELNPWAWSGDHSMARDLVPGTLVSSKPIRKSNPSILDLPVTILDYFGISKPEQMVGRSIYKA